MTENRIAKHIEMWAPERLKVCGRNPRQHPPAQIAQLQRSIEAFGFNCPILASPDGEIIAGHARALAARRLNLAEVPVIVLEHLNPGEQRAFGIADNQLALNAVWDEEMLKREIEALEAAGCPTDLLGFSDEQMAALLRELQPVAGRTDEESVPPLPESAVTRPGDMWVLGEHRVVCGDATRPETLAQLLNGHRADMAFSDPPYNVGYRSRAGSDAPARPMANDDLGMDFEPFLEAACRCLLSVTEGAVYLCMSSSELHTLHRAFLGAGGHWSTFLIWVKSTFTLGRSDYQRQYEPILYGWREGWRHYWCGARDQGDVWFVDKPRLNDLHPTMKPVALIEQALRNSSRRGGVVLDPFAGSGSTLIACHKTERRARLAELEPRYVDTIVQRWEEFTGGEARLEADSCSFAQVRRARAPAQAESGATVAGD